jgi:uncharacterized protein Usg
MSDDARKLLEGYRLTTVEILYHLPDYPSLLQTFVWQRLDRAPDFPRLQKYLDFWAHNLDGKLHSVNVAHAGLVAPNRFRHVAASTQLH